MPRDRPGTSVTKQESPDRPSDRCRNCGESVPWALDDKTCCASCGLAYPWVSATEIVRFAGGSSSTYKIESEVQGVG